MHIEYAINFDEFAASNRACLKNGTLMRRINYLFCSSLGPMIGVPVLLYAGYRYISIFSIENAGASAGLFAGLAAIGLLWSLAPLRFRRLMKKRYKELKLDRPLVSEIEPSGIHIERTSGETESTMKWGAFEKYYELPIVFTLLLSPITFVCVPKRVLTPDQLTELRILLQTNIVAK